MYEYSFRKGQNIETGILAKAVVASQHKFNNINKILSDTLKKFGHLSLEISRDYEHLCIANY